MMPEKLWYVVYEGCVDEGREISARVPHEHKFDYCAEGPFPWDEAIKAAHRAGKFKVTIVPQADFERPRDKYGVQKRGLD